MEKNNTLEVTHVSRHFKLGGMILGTRITAVDDVNFELSQNKPWILSIVGESGSGKTTLARMMLGLLPMSHGSIKISGSIVEKIKGKEQRNKFRKNVQPIFQNPFSSFSARNKVDSYLFKTALNYKIARTKEEAVKIIEEKLTSVGLTYSDIKDKYPNQFSGGELQRICIARALITNPSIIIADEPVAMIDASLRMNIVNLFKKLRDEYGVSFVYITHDLSTAYYVSDYIMIMYRGNLIESGDARTILKNPGHPYTSLLLDSIPKVGKKWDNDMKLPDLESKEYQLTGCKFSKRCPKATERCKESKPTWQELGTGQKVYCDIPNKK